MATHGQVVQGDAVMDVAISGPEVGNASFQSKPSNKEVLAHTDLNRSEPPPICTDADLEEYKKLRTEEERSKFFDRRVKLANPQKSWPKDIDIPANPARWHAMADDICQSLEEVFQRLTDSHAQLETSADNDNDNGDNVGDREGSSSNNRADAPQEINPVMSPLHTLGGTAPSLERHFMCSRFDDAGGSMKSQVPVDMANTHQANPPLLALRGSLDLVEYPLLSFNPQYNNDSVPRNPPDQSITTAQGNKFGQEDMSGEMVASTADQAQANTTCDAAQTKSRGAQTSPSSSWRKRKPVDLTVDLSDVSDDVLLDILLLNPTVATQFRRACAARLQQHQQTLDRAYDQRLAELEDYTRKWRETTKELWVQLKWGPVGDASTQTILAWKGPKYMGARSQRYPLRSQQARLNTQLPTIDPMTGELRACIPTPVTSSPQRQSSRSIQAGIQAEVAVPSVETPPRRAAKQAKDLIGDSGGDRFASTRGSRELDPRSNSNNGSGRLDGDRARDNSTDDHRALTLSPFPPQLRRRPQRSTRAGSHYDSQDSAPSYPNFDKSQSAAAKAARETNCLPAAAGQTASGPRPSQGQDSTLYSRVLALHKEFRKSGFKKIPKSSTKDAPSPRTSSVILDVIDVDNESKNNHREVIFIDDSSDEGDIQSESIVPDSGNVTSASRKHPVPDDTTQSPATKRPKFAIPEAEDRQNHLEPGDIGGVQAKRSASEVPVTMRAASTAIKPLSRSLSVDLAAMQKHPNRPLDDGASIRDPRRKIPDRLNIPTMEEGDTKMIEDQSSFVSSTQEIERVIEEQLSGTREVDSPVKQQPCSTNPDTFIHVASIRGYDGSDGEEYVQMIAEAADLRKAPEQDGVEKSSYETHAEMVLRTHRDRELTKNAAQLDAK